MLRRLILAAAAATLIVAPSAEAAVLPECVWALRSDPIAVNVLYPDEDAVYYIAALPAGEYTIRGDFPHARYMSFTTYNGLPIDALLDATIPADAGAVNPFVAGASRRARKRSYTVRIKPQAPPESPEPGVLYAGPGQLPAAAPAFYLFYRIYVPDRRTGPRGGVALPRIETTGAASADVSAVACDAARDAVTAAGAGGVQSAYARTDAPPPPAALRTDTSPPTWTVESGLTAAALGTAGQGNAVSGGPGSNPHNRYLAASVSRGLGPVLVLHGRAPTVPATYRRQRTMGSGDLRYWSFCQNSRTTRYVACLSDSHIKLDPPDASGHRTYTIALSAPADRPTSARNWLPFGPEPEAQVLYRHMLPSAAFLPRSAQGIDPATPVAEAMGPYYPRGAYCTAAAFDKDACGLKGTS